MFKFIFVVIFFSYSAMSDDLMMCLSNGDCQKHFELTKGSNCYLVKTGTDVNGTKHCAVRCFSVTLGSYCKEIKGELFGYCKREKAKNAIYNEGDPNRCINAIDP